MTELMNKYLNNIKKSLKKQANYSFCELRQWKVLYLKEDFFYFKISLDNIGYFRTTYIIINN